MLGNDDLFMIEEALAETVNRKVKIVHCRKHAHGYHSDTYVLTTVSGRKLLCRIPRLSGHGFESPVLILSSYLTNDTMQSSSIGVVVDGRLISKPQQVMQVQHFLGEGRMYMPSQRPDKYLDKIIDFIAGLHLSNCAQANAWYNYSLAHIMTHPELGMALLMDFPKAHPIITPEESAELFRLFLGLLHTLRNRKQRTVRLHGDFRPGNVFIDLEDHIQVIDFSRVPFGEPGIDIGWWMDEYLWLEYVRGGYRDVGEYFLGKYIAKTTDQFITTAMSIVFALRPLIRFSPVFFPDLKITPSMRAYYAQVKKILLQGEFTWD